MVKRRPGGGGRDLTERVRTARGRSQSSTRWLQRQLNDPYVARARREGWRSRAAFKLIEMDEKFHLLRPGARVVDLGAAPGGWTQVAVHRVRAGQEGGGRVVAIDVLPMEPVAGATEMVLDFLDPAAPGRLREAIGGGADVVLSDMAAPSTGHAGTDHSRIMLLAETALDFALEILADGGAFVAKVLKGGGEASLVDTLKRRFAVVKHVKPPASRPESAELYVVATGFKGRGGEG